MYLLPFTRSPESSKYKNETTILGKKMKKLINGKTEVLLEPGSASTTSGKKKNHVPTVLLLTAASVWKTEFKTKYSFAEQQNRTKIFFLH